MRARRTGFTLLEVVLAVSLTGMLLAAATTIVVAVSNIWIIRENDTFFVDHVDGVSEFLQTCLDRAGVVTAEAGEAITGRADAAEEPLADADPAAGNPERPAAGGTQPGGRTAAAAGDEPVRFAYLPGDRSRREQYISFELADRPPLLAGVETEIQKVNCYLHFEQNSGLSLLWSSNLQEEVEDVDDLFRSQVSPLVTDIRYIYYEEDFADWEVEEEPREAEGGAGTYELPPFIQLVFTYEDETIERLFTMPIRSTGALLF